MKYVIAGLLGVIFAGVLVADEFARYDPFSPASSYDPFEDARQLPAAPAPKKVQVPSCPGCACGCQEGKPCTCADMKKEKPKTKVVKAAKQYTTVCGPNGCVRVEVGDKTEAYYAQPTYSGNCGPGGCGTSGRVRILGGRFRR